MSDPEPTPKPGPAQICPSIQDRKVLVIEDSRTQRAYAVSLVRSLGAAEVFEAADGIEALEFLEREPGIQLVLCDLEMPRMDGMALIGEMAARSMNPHLIILSSQEAGILASVQHMAVSYGLTTSGVIPKPLTCENLVQTLACPPFTKGVTGQRPAAPERAKLTLPEIQTGLLNGEFFCFFQPLLTMQTGFLRGVEALVRWQHPVLGLLSPAAFLPQMEEDKELMSELTFIILGDIGRQWHEWKQHGLEVELSVNLSASSIGTLGFAERILDTVSRHDLPPRMMVLEVTESASVSNLGHTLANLARLRMKGFKLSIDDFGTGYATYEQLERIPFTELKIDISITKEVVRSKKHAIMARNLLRLAKDLGLYSVAEGIETQETWDVLKEFGCDCGQGYFLGRPMAGSQLEAWARQDRSHL